MDLANNNLLMILISIVFIYALLSILVSIVIEAVNYRSEARGKYLKRSIYKLLKDPLNNEYGYLFYNHFMIAGLKTFRSQLPQYISSSMFAEAFIDTIAAQAKNNRRVALSEERDSAGAKQFSFSEEAPPESVIDRFKTSVGQMNASPFKDLLQAFVDKSEGDYSRLKGLIEQWFNDYMDRVSGWYKSEQKTKLIIAGFAVAIALNVDSLHLIKILTLDENLKNSLVREAESLSDNYENAEKSKVVSSTELISLVQERNSNDSTAKSFTEESAFGMESIDNENTAEINEDIDSISQVIEATDALSDFELTKLKQADTVLSLLQELNVPIGWNCSSAPLSWFCDHKHSYISNSTLMHNAPQSQSIIRYLEKRNTWDIWSAIKWFVGIVISGFALSFGAPFWFDLLTKLVNIRRAGKRPINPTKVTVQS